MDSLTLRKTFADFFRMQRHKEIASGSLIPSSDDPTVLFTTAGMQPLIPYLMGAKHPKGTRIFDTQKCFRTPDIDEVGDDTHHTFFEMLGNWSLGDYFKEEAIDMAYNFFVHELKLDPKRFAITIFAGDNDAPRDDEAEQCWLNKGISPKQIFPFDKTDNFWGPAGSTGPCGPCSEIHYDRGEQYGTDVGPNSDENQRYVEIWNLVFMEYMKHEDGSYSKLQQKNVDTGVGFERLLAVLQKKDSAFDTELFTDILQEIAHISGKKYTSHMRGFRIIADHIRGSVFAIADGVTPSNEGRGYVLRRLIRRAIREGKKMGISSAFLPRIAEVVLQQYASQYPEIQEGKSHILSVLTTEETAAQSALEKGEKVLLTLQEKDPKNISAQDAFLLFDTHGFPLDLTKDFALQHGMTVDEEGFAQEMNIQKKRSKANAGKKFERGQATAALGHLSTTDFTGYADTTAKTTVLGMHTEESGETCIVLTSSPFYAESGGQVGDSGEIIGEQGTLQVTNCQKTATGVFLHFGILSGEMHTGESVTAAIDSDRREKIMRHHSLAHLFLGAAQKVLGSEVHQAGSHVNEHRMRFDFSFPRALSRKERDDIEKYMYMAVEASEDIHIAEKSIEEARSAGAEATFGEKYGDTVRTVKMAEFSHELCGGTHVTNTAQIGSLKIISESGVSAGVRRVEAVCGRAAQALLDTHMHLTADIAIKLKVPTSEILHRIDILFSEKKKSLQNIKTLEQKNAEYEAKHLLATAKEQEGQKIIILTKEDRDGENAGTLARLLVKKGVDIVILTTLTGNTVVASSGVLSAKEILTTLSKKFGGGGGGSKSFASGGGMQKGVSEQEIREVCCV